MGLNFQHWDGEQGSRRLEFSVLIWIMVSGWSSPLSWCLGRSFRLCSYEDALFAYGEDNPWRIVWQSLFSFAEWDLGRAVSSIGTVINFLLGRFLLKNMVYKQLSTPKRRDVYSLLINRVQKEWGCCT